MNKKFDSKIRIAARKVMNDEKSLSEVIRGLASEKPKIKYQSGKILMFLSQENPKMLYPKWDSFVDLLNNENTFMKSIGIIIISNLTRTDTKNKFDKIFDKFYKLLNDESMITAANLAGYSGMIGQAKPELQTKITNSLLSIDKTHHSPECKNIIKGKAILSLGEYFEQAKDKKKIIQFVKRESKNTRSATRKKAERFLKKWDKGCL
ncbi:MAG: hypothetical protein AMJ73_03210 [candidate division Zixibacteria bacterium SM1_73]|nr:MAG: hypothetical protein AMJ73_03210 [candidate division Zixibacteria bacterium SM1_73]